MDELDSLKSLQKIGQLNNLLAFDAVAKFASFSAAARHLHISQSAISHRIRALEEELGVQLFIRSSRSVRLSTDGEILARASTSAFQRISEALDEIDSRRGAKILNVSCSPSFAIRWLVPHLIEFREHVPDLDIRLSAEARVMEPGRQGIDVCVRFGPGGYTNAQAQKLTRARLVPVCSPLFVAQHEVKDATDLDPHWLIHDEVLVDHPEHVGWEEWLEHARISGVDASHGLRFSHAHMAIEAAIAGQGIALARDTLVARELAAGRLVAPFDLAVESGLTYWVLYADRQKPEIQIFIDWLIEALADPTS